MKPTWIRVDKYVETTAHFLIIGWKNANCSKNIESANTFGGKPLAFKLEDPHF